ncbi:dentin matrix acidic phosphoprotein 1-like isoform X2 [Plectropomus leopardus]|uniref:dentin matrix acidic phosphoprotein 1-like isoform X2 n=1 Tax=Plectropomus leopardus TaxID=160734 RepID=UPI001C4B1A1A|nr:dentin matrix acidic phosphoprotein 1-like isoform X2 [Plectropomus leopardus]
MEQSFADVLSDAFSETAVLSFPDEDLDFENLNFDEKFREDKTQENLPTKEDEALHQEATVVLSNVEKDAQATVLSSIDNVTFMDEQIREEQCDDKSDEEDSEGVMCMDKKPEEDYTSSEQEGSVSGEDEEDEEEDSGPGEKPGDLLRSVFCDDNICDGKKEEKIFAEGQPLAPEGAENPQFRNEEQGESDEEVSYFERVPEGGSEMMIRGDGSEEDKQQSEEEKEEGLSECEGMKIEQEENVLAPCLEPDNPCRDDPAKASLEFPEISVQSLQDLIAEVESEECGEKMKDFSGEEHQDAGESFADYPSDFSSCEYVEEGGENQERNHQSSALACAFDSSSIERQDTCLERAVATVTWMEGAEDIDEEADGYLYSKDLEDVGKFGSLDVATEEKEIIENVSEDEAAVGCDDGGETGESDSYSSSDDDDVQEKRSSEELSNSMCVQESNKREEETLSGSTAAFSEDYNSTYPAGFNINWNLDVLTTETFLSEDLLTTDEAETPFLDVTQPPAEVVSSYSERRTTNPSNQGSLDDSFFFNTEHEAAEITELGQLGDDEYEEERNWEQEQERIKAFYEFYDDSDGENEGRQIKVQFCADPLSQVIHYETNSDVHSLSSSTEGEEDQSSTETSEELKEPDDTMQITPACDPPDVQLPETVPDISDTHVCTRKHKCFNMLKLTLKMGVVVLTGLLMFWWATDQEGWFSHLPFI